MAVLGVLGFDHNFVSRAIHPLGSRIDGLDLDPRRQQFRGVGDFTGEGRDAVVLTSDQGVSLIEHDGTAFRRPVSAPRNALLGHWSYDAPTRTGRDRVMAVGRITDPARDEMLIWADTGMAVLGRRDTTLTSTRVHPNGTRLGGWVLSTVDNQYQGTGRFDASGTTAMVLISPWGLGVVSLAAGTHLAMVATRTQIGGWLLRADRDRIVQIADFDGDGQDELLISGLDGIGILKVVDGGLVCLAVHHVGSSLNGYVVGDGSYPVAARLRRDHAGADLVAKDGRGLHVLTLNANDGLIRRAFVPNGTRVDGWIVDTQHNTLQTVGDLNANGNDEVLLRSPWGIGVMNVGADNQFRCQALHPYDADVDTWPLRGSDIIAGVGRFVGPGRRELLMAKPWPDRLNLVFREREFVNWHGNIRRDIRITQPESLGHLVFTLRQSSDARMGSMGSGWSFTDCVLDGGTDSLIDTSALNVPVGGLLPDLIDDRTGTAGNRLVHVEAGIKLYELNILLDRLGLALPTLGGSRGQSLAGVLSTGVHGSDAALPPIADAVRAIHLVGPTGQQWWVEPAVGAIGTAEAFDRARARGVLDPGITTIFDDAWFNAVLVSMGCAGVIYSVVLECRPAFKLVSTTISEPWSTAQRRIRGLTRRSPVPPRYLEINVNPNDQSCRVVVRMETTGDDLFPAGGGGPSEGELIAVAALLGPPALGVLTLAIADYIARVTSEIAFLAGIPFIGPWLAGRRTAEALRPLEDLTVLLADLGLAAVDLNNPQRVAEILPNAINVIWAIGAFVVPGRALVAEFQRLATDAARPLGITVGPSYRVSTGQPERGSDGAQNHSAIERLIESYEYAVPAARAVDFVNRLIAVVAELRRGSDALVVNLNLRFTGRTRATVGMQQFDRTCHVEIYTTRGLRGNDAFRARLDTVVREFGALPHWGQFHDPSHAKAFTDLGLVAPWQQVIRAMSGGSQRFFSGFARARGLLP